MTKIVIFAKNLEGGTGTFVENLLKISDINNELQLKVISIEQPRLRKFKKRVTSLHLQKTYPEKYKLSCDIIISLIKEFFQLKQIFKKTQPDIIITIDSHCLLIAYLVIKTSFKKKFNCYHTQQS